MSDMRVAIVGSRGFANAALVDHIIERLIESYGARNLTIVSGGAEGADTLALDSAAAHKVKQSVFLPEWEVYGKSAGYRRNVLIVNDSTFVIALFADGPKSRGTQHTVDIALSQGRRVHIYHEGRWENHAAK